MTTRPLPQPRSLAIAKSWSTLNWASVFAAIIYPVLGVTALAAAILIGVFIDSAALHWWYAPAALFAGAASLVICNMGIGVLHRVWQHKAGELRWPAQIITAVNCLIAMQGRLKDWVNYHSQHHRLSDKPGDPHNPAEGKLWAWMGWLFWRDPDDLNRPLAMWLRDNKPLLIIDRHYSLMTLAVHLFAPALVYLAVWLAGGPLLLILMMHAAAVIARGIQFHATILGVNVFGHMKTPAWADWLLAILTGGEAFHDHHHAEPTSALHLPRKGLINRLVDYNGTVLLIFEKLRWARDLKIAPQFAAAPARLTDG